MQRRAPGLSWLLVGASLAGSSAPATAQSERVEHSGSVAKTRAASDEASGSLEFLEFLGEWESASGEWIDPVEVQSEDWPTLSNDSADAKKAENGDAN